MLTKLCMKKLVAIASLVGKRVCDIFCTMDATGLDRCRLDGAEPDTVFSLLSLDGVGALDDLGCASTLAATLSD